jgi:hypothetical protein
MRDQAWDRHGKLVADLEWIREPEGLMCYDRLSGVKRPAVAHEVERWHQLEALKLKVLHTPAAEQIKPSFLDKLWNFFRG